ncbi:MAG TPA: DUF1918 domain-containing protein [Baekduia sp.]|nr:DUF1918 domain-containing protein [Baekduia sp.]
MSTPEATGAARAGDRIEARSLHGQLTRSGEILEALGQAGHQRYRVRWDDGHESIVFPADGVTVVPAQRHAARSS